MTSEPDQPPVGGPLARRESIQLHVPEAELPASLRRRFGQGEADLARGVSLHVDRSAGLSLSRAGLQLATVAVLGVLAWGGFSALWADVLINPLSLPRALFWGVWGLLAAMVGAMASLGLLGVLLGVLRGARVDRRIHQGRWPYGLFIMPGALVYRSEDSCHVLPRGQILTFDVARGGDDYHLCPAVIWRDAEGERRVLALEGNFNVPTGQLQQTLWRWLNEGQQAPDEATAEVADRRAPPFERGLPPEARVSSVREFALWSTPNPPADSRLERVWRRWSGRASEVEREGTLRLEPGHLVQQLVDGRQVRLRLEAPFSLSVSAWLVSDQTAEVNLTARAQDAPPATPSLSFRVRLPQAAVSAALPLHEAGHAYLTPGDFRALWPVLRFHAALHGPEPGDALSLGHAGVLGEGSST